MNAEKDRHRGKGFFLRMPATLHRKVKSLARAQRRTMNAQIVTILEQAVATTTPRKKKA